MRQTLTEILKILADSAVRAGLITALIGGVCAMYMLIRTIKRVKQASTTKLDALYLAYSSPGFSRFSILNSPDTIGVGLYAALALEQVGAINDIRHQIDVNLSLYPEWPAVYLSAARYSALVGEKQMARDYLSIANTLINSRQLNSVMPQLDLSIIQELITSKDQSLESTTSIDTMFDELRKKPLQLILARSVWLLVFGIGLLFLGILLYLAESLI